MHRISQNREAQEAFHLESELAQIELLLQQQQLPAWQCAALRNRHMELCRSLESLGGSSLAA